MSSEESQMDYEYSYLGEEARISELPSGILVLVEGENGKLKEVSLQVLGLARQLADALGVRVEALLDVNVSEDQAKELIHYGADKVYQALSLASKTYDTLAYAQTLTEVIQKNKPEIVLAGLTPMARDLMPRVAQRLQTGLVSGCTALDIDTSERLLLATRPVYGGKLMETLVCETARPQMALVAPGVASLPFKDTFRDGEIEIL